MSILEALPCWSANGSQFSRKLRYLTRPENYFMYAFLCFKIFKNASLLLTNIVQKNVFEPGTFPETFKKRLPVCFFFFFKSNVLLVFSLIRPPETLTDRHFNLSFRLLYGIYSQHSRLTKETKKLNICFNGDQQI